MPYPATRYVSALLLATYVSACTSWKVQHVPPEKTFADSLYARRGVRVTTLDTQRVEIRHPRLTEGTISGRNRSEAMVAIPLENVRELAVKRPDGVRTVLLVFGSIVGAGALTVVALCAVFCGYQD